jgi:hypothetical protein
VLAYAKIFMASAATALNRLGVVMVPRVQLTETVRAARHPADRSPQTTCGEPGFSSYAGTGASPARRVSEPVARGPGR